MPIFEYRCSDCGESFDMLIKGRETARCPACHGTALSKKFSLFAVQNKSDNHSPGCAPACDGFDRGSCGSGLCGGHNHN